MIDLLSPLTMKLRSHIIRLKMYFEEYEIIIGSTRLVEEELFKIIKHLQSLMNSDFCKNDEKATWMIKSLISKYSHIQGRITALRSKIYLSCCALKYKEAIPYIRAFIALGDEIIEAIYIRRYGLWVPSDNLELYIRKNKFVLNAVIETIMLDNKYNRYKQYYNALDPVLYHDKKRRIHYGLPK